MDTGYSSSETPSTTVSPGGDSGKTRYWSVDKCRKAYLDYLTNKTAEIEEQKESRRYYHGAQWTDEQLRELKRRKQPPVRFNRINRKIDGTVGLIERLRQDPKAYARTPKEDQGAELATAAIRYVLDQQLWKMKSPEVARWAAIDGISGLELLLGEGDTGDREIELGEIDGDSFFYDPRSYRPDLGDARYMGVSKWMDVEAAGDLVPDKAEELEKIGSSDSELSTNPDREKKFFTQVGDKKLIRVVEIWYQVKGKWCWTLFTGSLVLMEGESYLFDEKGKSDCKYIMLSCNVDHDGDRYGLVRNMKSAQDIINHTQSKLQHLLASKRISYVKGAIKDKERFRREAARPDGLLEFETQDLKSQVSIEDTQPDFVGQLKMLEGAAAEIENYGPNQALVGDLQNQSGRAIQLLQQAGMAELGPYILAYRNWKLRLYRAIWNSLRRYWSAERWIRVTDDQDVAQFIQINGTMRDQFGRPVIGPDGQPVKVNPIGSLDVDIIIDEGPDVITAAADTYENLTLLAQHGQVPWQVLVELNPNIQHSVKQKVLEYGKDPMQQKAQQIELAGADAKVKETQSKTMLNVAKANDLGTPELPAGNNELPMNIRAAEALAGIEDKQASAREKHAKADKISIETALAPHLAAHNAAMDLGNMAIAAQPQPEAQEA